MHIVHTCAHFPLHTRDWTYYIIPFLGSFLALSFHLHLAPRTLSNQLPKISQPEAAAATLRQRLVDFEHFAPGNAVDVRGGTTMELLAGWRSAVSCRELLNQEESAEVLGGDMAVEELTLSVNSWETHGNPMSMIVNGGFWFLAGKIIYKWWIFHCHV